MSILLLTAARTADKITGERRTTETQRRDNARTRNAYRASTQPDQGTVPHSIVIWVHRPSRTIDRVSKREGVFICCPTKGRHMNNLTLAAIFASGRTGANEATYCHESWGLTGFIETLEKEAKRERKPKAVRKGLFYLRWKGEKRYFATAEKAMRAAKRVHCDAVYYHGWRTPVWTASIENYQVDHGPKFRGRRHGIRY